MIGEKLSPILCEIEDTLLEFEASKAEKSNFTKEAFRASIKIFTSAMMDKMWELQEKELIDTDDRLKMAIDVGEEIRRLVKVYTDIDTHKIYE
jgi:hypothetical protein